MYSALWHITSIDLIPGKSLQVTLEHQAIMTVLLLQIHKFYMHSYNRDLIFFHRDIIPGESLRVTQELRANMTVFVTELKDKNVAKTVREELLSQVEEFSGWCIVNKTGLQPFLRPAEQTFVFSKSFKSYQKRDVTMKVYVW